MHDGGGDRAQSVAALETILQQLSQQGYTFRNVYVP
jgi:peptidoglycan/xylan/chitin deacetylase (PgdA/CDA1 family)